MRMPSVCPVVAHGWNIIEYLPLPKTLGWVSGGGANTLLGPGRAGPCGSFLVPEDHAPLCVWCRGSGWGWWGSGVSPRAGPVLVAPRVGGVGVWVSGGGSWFFHSGREHLGITALTAPACV